MRRVTVFCAAVAIFALAGLAQAVTVTYTVDGWGPTQYPGPVTPPEGAPHDSYPGDTVTLDAYSDSLSVTVTNLGETETFIKKINTLQWIVDWTYNGTDDCLTNDGDPASGGDWPELQFTINAVRGMTVDGAGGSLSQGGLLRTSWYDDYLSLASGPTVVFLVPGYKIEVTPLLLGEESIGYWTGNPPCTQPSRSPSR